MKKTNFPIPCFLMLCVCFSAHGQGTFQNLNFEEAVLVPIPGDPYGRVEFAPAFPGWTGYVAQSSQSAALHDRTFLDSSGIAILDAAWNNSTSESRGNLISGDFTALL